MTDCAPSTASTSSCRRDRSGFVGPNGAGKTTTIQMLLGLFGRQRGPPRCSASRSRTRSHTCTSVGALIEAPAFYPTLSGLTEPRGADRLGRSTAPGSTPCWSSSACVTWRTPGEGVLARDEAAARGRRRAAPGTRLAILDEPTNGLDPAGIREMRTILRDLADKGITVFVSSHLLAEIEAICDHLVMIDHGRLVFQGGVAELLDAQRRRPIATPEHPPTSRPWSRVRSQRRLRARSTGESVQVDGGERLGRRANPGDGRRDHAQGPGGTRASLRRPSSR